MKECAWTRKMCRELERCNAVVFACVAHKMQAPGWPDRWVCHRRWRGWLEFKGDNTRLTALQRKRIRDLNDRQPGSAFVVRHPNRIEDCDGNLIATFNSAIELLTIVQRAAPNM